MFARESGRVLQVVKHQRRLTARVNGPKKDRKRTRQKKLQKKIFLCTKDLAEMTHRVCLLWHYIGTIKHTRMQDFAVSLPFPYFLAHSKLASD